MSHQVQWTAPTPFWGAVPDPVDDGRLALRRPTILRYATDSFMELFQQTLDQDPATLVQFEAQFENWQTPTAGPAALEPEPVVALPSNLRALIRRRVAAKRAADAPLARTTAPKFATSTGLLEADASGASPKPTRPLKLYQPAHQRFYLVTACLVCRVPGLPDRTLDAGKGEKVTFVLRRLLKPSGASATDPHVEHAFIPSAGWRKVSNENAIELGEEQLPLFTSSFAQDRGTKRRLFAALIPVGRREQYLGAREAPAVGKTPDAPSKPTDATSESLDPGAPKTPVDARIALLSSQVAEPWKALLLRAKKAAEAIKATERAPDTTPSTKGDTAPQILKEAREAIQVGSWYTLLDFANYLKKYLPIVWKLITHETPTETPSPEELTLAGTLNGVTMVFKDPDVTTPHVAASLAEALTSVVIFEVGLERSTGKYDRLGPPSSEWPTFLFPLADPHGAELPGHDPIPSLGAPTPARNINALVALVGQALRPDSQPVAAMPLAAQPVFNAGDSGLFVIRCIFERPECGPIDPPLLSARSRQFELAGFFDPDAPARPIRIALPIDTSPAGLRKFDKNTAFMVSDMLCGQIARAKGLGFVDLVLSVLPFPFHKGLSAPDTGPCKDGNLELGMICSLSIPIITICALILLLIIVNLLDVIFKWMPYLIFCFPLPGFKAKKDA